MKLYNTLTRQIESIKPINGSNVSVYTCGPTVYDYSHIGHWFNYIRMDMLIRTLNISGFKTKWVMNITDVGHLVSDSDEGEDKLQKGANREGKSAWEIAKIYTEDFIECMNILNISKPDYIVKATEHIKEQIELIQILESKNFTYVIDDGVYFDTTKFEGYSAFARLDLDDQRGSGRVISNPQKHNPQDFALWKFSPKESQRDMEWDSPWGKGFPGWHIECSAMSMKYLGETIDIHTGGIDHIPVHHTNEIAQSEAATGKRFVNLWMHSNHVLIDNEKISKSSNNGIRLQHIINKGFSADSIRIHVLESHYSKQSKFSYDGLISSQNRLKSLEAIAVLKWQSVNSSIKYDFKSIKNNILLALKHNLDTPKLMFELSKFENYFSKSFELSNEQVPEFEELLEFIDNATGLSLSNSEDIDNIQRNLIDQREHARKTNNWSRADQIRTQLEQTGLKIIDTPNGQFWSRI